MFCRDSIWTLKVIPLPTLAPRCLDKFRVDRQESAAAGLPIPDSFTSYALGCHCGCVIWRVLGNWLGETAEFEGPLYAQCSNCGSRLRIINTATDGFNGEIGDGIVEDETAIATWMCCECGTAEGFLITSFGYHFEPDEDVRLRMQDYFDAFILTHVCANSRATVQVSMFDCA